MNSDQHTNEFEKNSRLTCEWKPEEEGHSFNFDEEIFVYDQDEAFNQDDAFDRGEAFNRGETFDRGEAFGRGEAFNQDDAFNRGEATIRFNALYGTHYTQENLEKFTNYREHYGLEVEDAIDYVQSCHCCNEQLDIFAGEYCSGGCHNHVEELGLPCFWGASCLICNREPFPQNQCDDCSSEITYPPFEYYYDDEIHDVDSIHYVCNACFCRNSNYSRRHVGTYPIRDHPCHNPLVSAIYCCNQFTQMDDVRVWSDLYQYMY